MDHDCVRLAALAHADEALQAFAVDAAVVLGTEVGHGSPATAVELDVEASAVSAEFVERAGCVLEQAAGSAAPEVVAVVSAESAPDVVVLAVQQPD
jgi:hypothetical protein